MSNHQSARSDEKLSVPQVAIEVGCHPNTVWNQIKRGHLPAVRFGPRLVRIRRSDLEFFLTAYAQSQNQSWLSVTDGQEGA